MFKQKKEKKKRKKEKERNEKEIHKMAVESLKLSVMQIITVAPVEAGMERSWSRMAAQTAGGRRPSSCDQGRLGVRLWHQLGSPTLLLSLKVR